MKIMTGAKEDGVVVGNAYDKYGSCNPVVRSVMRGFHDALEALVDMSSPSTIHEVGCGEGYWVMHWLKSGLDSRGTDFSTKVIDVAKENARSKGLDQSLFNVRSIYDLAPPGDSADLVVCCEVLEHLEDPERALRALRTIVTDKLIISVPREPIWRILNIMRGAYIADFGNTPGHIQHWSQRSFVGLVGRYFEIVELRSPLPWVMLLCRAK